MAFKWLTQYNSPNYTPASRVQATWGQPRTVKAIAIHWWGDPNQKPSFENVVNYLCRPGGGSSAHIVATGTGRRAACLVNLTDASWATNSANPYTISIECDPRCRDEDYDVVAEVIAQLRSIYGNIPLVPHKQFVATACPGNYSLSRLDKIARTKSVSKSDPWGKVKNKTAPKPAPVAKPYKVVNIADKKVELIRDAKVWNLDFTSFPKAKALETLKKGFVFTAKEQADHKLGSHYYLYGKGGVNRVDTKDYVAPKPVEPKPEPEKPSEPTESPSKVGLDEKSTTLLQDVLKALTELLTSLKSIFKIGD